MDGGSTDMTLAFELGALQALADPEAAFTGARRWTSYLGVISEEPTYVVTNFTRKHRIRQDFFSGPRGRAESLQNVAAQFDTERYVLVGTGADDEQLAAETGWEYVGIEAAAEAAGWQLGDPESAESEASTREDWP